jgi:hypothetical protein
MIVVPESSEPALPHYVRGLEILTYPTEARQDAVAASLFASAKIRGALRGVDAAAFHTELPGTGLAYGYFLNFVSPLVGALSQTQAALPDRPAANDFTLTVLLPDHILNREEADRLLRRVASADNLVVPFRDGRSLSVYVLPQNSPSGPLHVIDVPTTLQTSREVIERIYVSLGSGDRDFCTMLEKREIECFGRTIRSLIHEAQPNSTRVFVVALTALQDHLQRLHG